MIKLLIQGEVILARDVVERGDSIHSPDAVYPKHVVEGWQIVDVALPSGFVCSDYTWNGSAVVAKPPKPLTTEQKAAHNALILADILALEVKQARAVREIMLSQDISPDKSRLRAIESEIASLRAGLK